MSEATPLETIFFAALEKPAGERAAFVAAACAGNDELQQRVERMLAAQYSAGDFLESPPSAMELTADTPSQPLLESAGTQIGPYKLLQQLGEGGFGVVFMAEQLEPVRRRVAVKVIKPGMDTRQVIARFDAERQALAVMDHPNIARVLDAGSTASGRPFFVMELVRGVSITQYCDENSLAIRERLELFAAVCRAIQHAHTKGIIHRDIKPSNVMVTQQDGQPVVKIIDFGIAKAMGQQLTDKTLFTEFAQIVGTPLYMSPEQAELSSTDIDTRSDVYSLGVLLYELLTGSTPVSKEQLKQAAFDEIRRIIREDEPPKPSTRISTADAAPSIAAQRHTEPARLAKLIRGELDWIVMKALEKDRSRRYETASGFARDIERYLNDEPVQACPPSTAYRFGKFARRNRGALVITCIAALTVLLALIGLTVSNVLITQERDLKVAALRTAKNNELAANIQKGIAERNAIKAATNEKKAKENELLANRRYYAAQMNLAMQAWQAGDLPRVLELLEAQRPKPGEKDLRGFEWFYLWRLVNKDGRSLQGHTDAIMALAFAPDGKTLASASWDWTVRLWDPSSLREERVLTGHSPWHLAFSPDSKLLAGGSGFEAQNPLWNVATGERVTTLPAATSGVAFSSGGARLFAGGSDASRLWEVPQAGQPEKIDQPGMLIGLFPDGKTAATLFSKVKNHEVRFWNTATGALQSKISVTGDVWSAALSPDGTQVALTTGYFVKVWNTATGLQQAEFSTKCIPRGVAFSRDGKRLAAGLEDRRAVIWDLTTNEQVAQYVHLDVVWTVAFSPDGKILAAGTLRGAIKLWHLAPTEVGTTILVPRPQCGQLLPGDRTLLVGSNGLGKFIDVVTGQEVATLPISNMMAISADASTLVARKSREEYSVWDIQTNRETATISLPQVSDVAPLLSSSPNGKKLAAFYKWRGNNTVTICDVATQQQKVLKIIPPDSSKLSVICAEFSPDGKLLAAGFQFQWVTIWDVETGQVKLQFYQPPAMMNVLCVAWAPGGKMLAIGTDTGTVTLWDVETGQRLAELRGHTLRVNSLAFSPDGNTLATAGEDKTVRLWDVITGQERSTLTGHTGGVGGVLFTSDGYTLATASSDGTVKLWRGATEADALAPRVATVKTESAIPSLPPGAVPLTEVGFRRALANLPDRVELHRELGRLLMAEGRHSDAEASLAEVVRLAPDEFESHFRLSDSFRAQKKFAAAEVALRAAIQLAPNEHKLHHALGWALEGQQKFAEEELAYREVIRLKPDLASAYQGLGRALRGQQKFAEASAAMSEAIRLDPSDIRLRDALGWNQNSAQDFAAAELTFLETVRQNPSQSSYFGLAHALRGQKKYEESLVPLRKGIELNRANHKGFETLAGTLMTLGRFAEAEVECREVIRLAPDYAGGHFGLGRALMDQRKLAEAVEPLQTALRLDPNHERAHGSLGFAFLEQRKFAEAEAELWQQIRRLPEDRGAHYNLAKALREQSKFADAIEPLRVALRLDPNRAYIHNQFGWIYMGLKNWPEAEAAFREAIRLAPTDVEGHQGLGCALVEQKKFADAEARLREVLRLNPKHPTAPGVLKRALVGQGKDEEASAVPSANE